MWMLISSGADGSPRRGRFEKTRLLMGGPATTVNFPYVCSVLCCGDKYHIAVSMCTIIAKGWAVASMSNMAFELKYDGEETTFYKLYKELRVVAGADALIPGAELDLHETISKNVQTVKVKNVHVIRNNKEVFEGFRPFRYSHLVNPSDLEKPYLVRRNVYDFEFPFAFLELEKRFNTTKNVDQIEETDQLNEDIRESFKTFIAINLGTKRLTCKVPGWGLSVTRNIEGVRRLVYQKVISIEGWACRNTYCTNEISTCTKYPNEKAVDVACFKSLQYGDVCELDEGAGLYCPDYHGGVIALVASSLDCGVSGTPPVYYLVSSVRAVLRRILREPWGPQNQ
ncbi:hypothetical protein GE061_012940 [Apolygus lucorum]|uniref:Peptidase S1 domain-containing protein n=1 Tax=Apolygus lucorum TaxID=248454 RepID=A0A8S9XU05_APOLU|nr:hypothetical protein GE061_012940 [Apolygus lucorum]